MSSTAAARKHLPSGGKVPEKVRIRDRNVDGWVNQKARRKSRFLRKRIVILFGDIVGYIIELSIHHLLI
jgi:hypothetical protein